MKNKLATLILCFAIVPAAAKKPPHKRPPPPAPAPAPPPAPEKGSAGDGGSGSGDETTPAALVTPVPPVTPAPAPPPKVEMPPPPTSSDDLDALRNEYDAIRDELFRSRARIGLIGEAVFKNKLVIEVDYKAARDWPLKRLIVQLDDKQVYGEDNPQLKDGKPVRAYDSFAGVGRHVLAVQVEAAGPESRVGFAATGMFFVDVPDGKTTHVVVTADESGDGPGPLQKRREGTYDLRLRADVRSEPLPVGVAGK